VGDILLSLLGQYGLTVGGPVISTVVLSLVVRVLWREAQEEQGERLTDLKQQFQDRLSDKNAELSQVWGELRAERDEKRRAQAANEGLESMLRREQDLTKAALEEAASWRALYKERSGRA
jgi:hypothetical protein